MDVQLHFSWWLHGKNFPQVRAAAALCGQVKAPSSCPRTAPLPWPQVGPLAKGPAGAWSICGAHPAQSRAQVCAHQGRMSHCQPHATLWSKAAQQSSQWAAGIYPLLLFSQHLHRNFQKKNLRWKISAKIANQFWTERCCRMWNVTWVATSKQKLRRLSNNCDAILIWRESFLQTSSISKILQVQISFASTTPSLVCLLVTRFSASINTSVEN